MRKTHYHCVLTETPASAFYFNVKVEYVNPTLIEHCSCCQHPFPIHRKTLANNVLGNTYLDSYARILVLYVELISYFVT